MFDCYYYDYDCDCDCDCDCEPSDCYQDCPDYDDDCRYSDGPWIPDGGPAPWDSCDADPDMCCGYDH